MTAATAERRLTLIVPSLLEPLTTWAQDFGIAPRAPALETLLSRAERQAAAEDLGLEASLCAAFDLDGGTELPAGALGYHHDTGSWPNGACLRADPVWLQTGIDQLVLGEAGAIDADEAEALVATLNGHFAADGLRFEAPRPARWYLLVEVPPDIRTEPPSRVLGRDIRAHLPSGREAARWHGLLNEAQMLLHGHSVNTRREARGLRPVNSLWLWGAGAPPQSVGRPWRRVWGDEPLAAALAQAAGSGASPLPSTAGDCLEDGSLPALAVLDALRPWAQADDPSGWELALGDLERDWFAPLAQALARGHLSALEIRTADGVRHCTTAWGQRRFWRRRRALLDFATARGADHA